jgi:hypothetical protein
MAKHSRAERRREYMTQTAHHEQQGKTGWKESFHLSQVAPIIAYALFNLRTAVWQSGLSRIRRIFSVSTSNNSPKGIK